MEELSPPCPPCRRPWTTLIFPIMTYYGSELWTLISTLRKRKIEAFEMTTCIEECYESHGPTIERMWLYITGA